MTTTTESPTVEAPVISKARERLEKLKAQSPIRESVEVQGETYHVQRLAFREVSEILAGIARAGYDPNDIHTLDGILAVMESTLSVAIRNADGSRYFAPGDVSEYYVAPGTYELINALYDKAIELNPDLKIVTNPAPAPFTT